MDICSRAIDEIITGAREFSEHNTCFRRFVDRMVIPGMILQLEDGNSRSWCLGPGLCLIPAPRTNAKGRHKFPDSILVRQVTSSKCRLLWSYIVFRKAIQSYS